MKSIAAENTMNPKVASYIRHYAFGLLTSSWNGAIKAVAAIIGVDGIALSGADSLIDKTSQPARILNVHEMICAFLGSFILHAFLYFYTHPFPESLETAAPFPPPNPKP